MNSILGTGRLALVVTTPITLIKNRDLTFGTRTSGDPAKSVRATDALNAAMFTVMGAKNKTFYIFLPANDSVMLKNGSHSIAVNHFVSEPSGRGTLNESGTQILRIGATLSDISNTRESGAYLGSFLVTVTY